MVNTNMVEYYIAFKNSAGHSSKPEQGAKISHVVWHCQKIIIIKFK